MAGTDRFRERVAAMGITADIREISESTHTALDAASAIGCPVEAIVKSLLFVVGPDAEPLLVLVSGLNRADSKLIESHVGAAVAMADAKLVRTATGYGIGGVPPLGHPVQLRTLIDRDLVDLEVVWAAAGSPNSVFPIDPGLLVELAGAEVLRVS